MGGIALKSQTVALYGTTISCIYLCRLIYGSH